MSKKQSEEVVEPVVTTEGSSQGFKVEQAEDFVAKNKNILGGVALVIAVSVAGFFFWNNSKIEKEKEAQLAIYPVQYYFSMDSVDVVLKGDGKNVQSALDIAEDYSGTKAGNLANYYAGVAYLKKGEYEKAIEFLAKFSSSDVLVQSRAYSLIGDANMELNKLDEAISYYEKASSNKPNAQYTPRYLTKLALAYELSNNNDKAKQCYKDIIEKYYSSAETANAKKMLAYLDAKTASASK